MCGRNSVAINTLIALGWGSFTKKNMEQRAAIMWSRENLLRAGKQPSKQKPARSCIHKMDKKAAV
jgi:hypothetical protein